MTCRVPQRYVWLKRFAVAFGLLLTVVVALPVLANWYAVPRLEALMAEARAERERWMEQARTDPPESALALLQTLAALEPNTPYPGALEDVTHEEPLGMMAPELVDEVLRANAEALRRADHFTRLEPQRWTSLPPPLEAVSYVELRKLARLLMLDGRAALRSHDWQRAADRQRQMLRVAEHAAYQDKPLEALHGFGYRGTQMSGITKTWLRSPGEPLGAARWDLVCLVDELLVPPAPAVLSETIGEQLLVYDGNTPALLQDLTLYSADFGNNSRVYEDWWFSHLNHFALIPVGRLNLVAPRHSLRLIRSPEKHPEHALQGAAQLVGWGIESTRNRFRRALQITRFHRYRNAIAIAAVCYRDDYGAWPETLEELVPRFLPRVLRDPHDANQPMAYVATADGLLIGNQVGPQGTHSFHYGLEYSAEALLRWNNYLATRHGPPREDEWQDPNTIHGM